MAKSIGCGVSSMKLTRWTPKQEEKCSRMSGYFSDMPIVTVLSVSVTLYPVSCLMFKMSS